MPSPARSPASVTQQVQPQQWQQQQRQAWQQQWRLPGVTETASRTVQQAGDSAVGAPHSGAMLLGAYHSPQHTPQNAHHAYTAAVELDDEDSCVICMEGRRESVLVPCGHHALCMACTLVLFGPAGTHQLCPVCREEVGLAVTAVTAHAHAASMDC